MADVNCDEATKPVEQRVHRYAGNWARDGSWGFTIHEYVHDTFIAFAADFAEGIGMRWIVSEKIAGLVATRISEGHKLITLDGTSAVLNRLR